MQEFIKSRHSLQDLEEFRDENGFINLTAAGIELTESSREEAGNPDRIKNWVDFNGKKVLIKGEAILKDEKNYGIYAELIIEEIAKRLGVPTAHYDLIKLVGQDGSEIMGVLSESVVDLETEQLVMLHDIIGDEPESEGDFSDSTSYEFTINKLREVLLRDGYESEDIEVLITDYRKRLMFSLSILETDNHIENVAFIKKVVDGKHVIEVSPKYDSESALMLDYDISTVKKLLEDYEGLKISVDEAHPRIGKLKSIEDGGFNSYWKDTMEALCEEDEIYDYYNDVIRGKVDMYEILESVESRIHAELPEDIKVLVPSVYRLRNDDMEKLIDGELEPPEAEGWNINSFLSSLIDRGTQNSIRTGEQMDVGKRMERDMEQIELNIDDFLNDIFNEHDDEEK